MKKDIPILEGKEVAIGYKTGKNFNLVADKISFTLPSGRLTCLLGPNGVGKSTLIKAILGQVMPIKGEILYQGVAIRKFNPKELAKKISVVLTDRVSSGNLTVHQLVALGRIPFTNWLGTLSEPDEKTVEEAIKATKIGYLRGKRISEISDGQLQKVMIARALAQDGELMILDEPTAHLDLVNRFEIMHLLRSIAQTQQKAILVVTHDLDIAIETADEFWLMPFEGPLVTGRPEDLILSGQISQLLPTDQLHFSPATGKIQFSVPQEYPQINGPEEVVQWLKLALRKNGVILGNHVKITAYKDPVYFWVEKGDKGAKVSSIEEILQELI
ncbi:MAG: ABC transporter ATP-binding protein [Anditalea sp.]